MELVLAAGMLREKKKQGFRVEDLEFRYDKRVLNRAVELVLKPSSCVMM